MRINISLIDFKRIQRAGPEAILMLRFAIAVNDLISGNYFLRTAKDLKANPKMREMGRGLSQFAIKIQIGHLCEALLLIRNSNDKVEPTLDTLPKLKRQIRSLSPRAQQSYRLLRRSLPGGRDHNKFKTYVENFRNQVSFHYDAGYRGRGKLRDAPVAKDALDRLAEESTPGRMVLGQDINTCRFSFADDVMDTAVCRLIWGIDKKIAGEDLQKAADKIAEWINIRAKSFVIFGGELCQHYFSQKQR
ncbi:MAG: hypothetical protein AB1757_29870 [Acidobacteriota bacterium]